MTATCAPPGPWGAVHAALLPTRGPREGGRRLGRHHVDPPARRPDHRRRRVGRAPVADRRQPACARHQRVSACASSCSITPHDATRSSSVARLRVDIGSTGRRLSRTASPLPHRARRHGEPLGRLGLGDRSCPANRPRPALIASGASGGDEGPLRLPVRRFPPRPPLRADRLRLPRGRVAPQGRGAGGARPAAAARPHERRAGRSRAAATGPAGGRRRGGPDQHSTCTCTKPLRLALSIGRGVAARWRVGDGCSAGSATVAP